MILEFKLLLILIAANGIPMILRRCMGATFSHPVDRVILSGITGATIVAFLLDFPVLFGVAFAALSLLGDLLSSFMKRRMTRPQSSKCIGLDQIPEALFPLATGTYWLDYGLSSIIIVILSFFLINLLIPTQLIR